MVLLAITTVFRTILIIIGVIVLLRFIGQLMNAKRNLEEEREMIKRDKKNQDDVLNAKLNFGKTTISKVDSKIKNDTDYTEFEEVK